MKYMKQIFEAILTQPAARAAEDVEFLAVQQSEFLSWE